MIIECEVQFITPIADNIFQIILKPEQKVNFKAGQYLQILVGDKKCPYSIGSSPHTDYLELQIFDDPERTPLVASEIKPGNTIRVELPCGDCYLPDTLDNNNGPVILLAAGTGFSQMKSIAEEIMARGVTNPIHLYWGNRTPDGFYYRDILKGWDQEHPNFNYHLVIDQAADGWDGRTGFLLEAVNEDFADFDDAMMFISGSPGMVHATMDAFKQRGLRDDQVNSDVFAFAPRA